MSFHHDEYGIKLVEFCRRDAEAEAHYSVVLRLSTLTGDEIELSRGLPASGTVALLVALRESCERALRAVDENER